MKTVTSIRLDASLQWAVRNTAGGHVMAECHALGLSMEGNNLDDLFANISESVQLVLNDLLRAGELDAFLRARGWRAFNMVNVSNIVAPVQFDVPIDLLMQAQRDSARSIHQ